MNFFGQIEPCSMEASVDVTEQSRVERATGTGSLKGTIWVFYSGVMLNASPLSKVWSVFYGKIVLLYCRAVCVR